MYGIIKEKNCDVKRYSFFYVYDSFKIQMSIRIPYLLTLKEREGETRRQINLMNTMMH
jgi:hypothetical protein